MTSTAAQAQVPSEGERAAGERAAGDAEPGTWAAGVAVAEYDSVRAPGVGWVGIRQFRRDPEGSFFVSGIDDQGRQVQDLALPDAVAFRVR